MYVCLCNALTANSVERAAADGATRPREVYEACGTKPQCGTCTSTILCMLRKMAQALPDPVFAGAD